MTVRPRSVACRLARAFLSSWVAWLLVGPSTGFCAEPGIPRLQTEGAATRLVVDGRPWLLLGAELGNSTATNADSLQPLWPKFRQLGLNALLIPVYWDLVESEEGRFDFAVLDRIEQQARENRMHLVLLWFGSWKNSMSSYAPAWIKRNSARFPRAVDSAGNRLEMLSPFYPENRNADVRAFAALLAHLRENDRIQRTVVMVQVENEIGMIPSARDHSPAANSAFQGPAPAALAEYLEANSDRIDPSLGALWRSAGKRSSGTWSELFGGDAAGEEVFMAWTFAQYTEAVAAAGKKEYPLPLYVNAALIRAGYVPGQYPAGGPLPHLYDVWRLAAPDIDLLAPDIYHGGFAVWARRYHRPGNPLFIPESLRGTASSVNGLYAYGELDAIGFSVFNGESMSATEARYLGQSFNLVNQLEQELLAHQGRHETAGFLSEGPDEKQPRRVTLGDYVLNVSFDQGADEEPTADGIEAREKSGPREPPPSGGLVILLGPDEFLFAGTGLTVGFGTGRPGQAAGILSDEEGQFTDGKWTTTTWLGGDQTNQGRSIRLSPGRFSLQRVKLYRY